jgi:hypothetical protein
MPPCCAMAARCAAAPAPPAAPPRATRGAAPRPPPRHVARLAPAPAATRAGRGPAAPAGLFRGLFGGGEASPPPPPPPADEDAVPPWLSAPYTVVRTTASYELRVYGSYTAARTPYEARPEGLARLAEYCDGANEEAAPLAGTQPLTMRYDPTPKARPRADRRSRAAAAPLRRASLALRFFTCVRRVRCRC